MRARFSILVVLNYFAVAHSKKNSATAVRAPKQKGSQRRFSHSKLLAKQEHLRIHADLAGVPVCGGEQPDFINC